MRSFLFFSLLFGSLNLFASDSITHPTCLINYFSNPSSNYGSEELKINLRKMLITKGYSIVDKSDGKTEDDFNFDSIKKGDLLLMEKNDGCTERNSSFLPGKRWTCAQTVEFYEIQRVIQGEFWGTIIAEIYEEFNDKTFFSTTGFDYLLKRIDNQIPVCEKI